MSSVNGNFDAAALGPWVDGTTVLREIADAYHDGAIRLPWFMAEELSRFYAVVDGLPCLPEPYDNMTPALDIRQSVADDLSRRFEDAKQYSSSGAFEVAAGFQPETIIGLRLRCGNKTFPLFYYHDDLACGLIFANSYVEGEDTDFRTGLSHALMGTPYRLMCSKLDPRFVSSRVNVSADRSAKGTRTPPASPAKGQAKLQLLRA